MIDLFENKLGKEYRVKISTEYYSKYKDVYSKYKTIYTKYSRGENVTDEELYELKNLLEQFDIRSSYKFFNSGHHQNEFSRRIDTELGLDTDIVLVKLFELNRYNIERIIKEHGITNINMAVVEKQDKYKGNINKDNIDKFVIRLINKNGTVSPILLAKHSYSLEFYDILTYRTVAFKNFKSGRTYGEWNWEYENLALRIYSAYVNMIKSEAITEARIAKAKEKRTKLDVMILSELLEYKKYFGDNFLNRVKDNTKELIMSGKYSVYAIQLENNEYNKYAEDELEMVIPRYVIEAIKNIAKSLEKSGKPETSEKILKVLDKIEQDKKELRLRNRESESDVIDKVALARKQDSEFWDKYSDYTLSYNESIVNIGLGDTASKLEKINKDNKVNRVYGVMLTMMTADALDINNKDLAKDRGKIYNDIIKLTNKSIDKEKLSKLIKELNKREVEKYLKDCIVESFVILVDRKRVDLRLLDDNVISFFREEARRKGHINWNPKSGESVERNKYSERGRLEVYGGIIIDGGNNDLNQSALQLKIVDNAIIDLCMLMGVQNPTSSKLNKFIELNVLHAKSQRPDVFELLPSAIETYLLNRDKKNFSLMESLDKSRKELRIYIPCEYYAYIKEVYNRNKDNKMLKRNYTAVLNILIYDYLIRITGKNYISI